MEVTMLDRAHRAQVALPAARTSPRDARQFLTATLHDWHVPEGPVEAACLLATELVTNAVLHAGTPMELVLEADADHLRVEVVDGAEHMPVTRSYRSEPLGITGRGLSLVRSIAKTWGVTPCEPGKSVWFELPLARTG
ncbi:MAG TPA: ATP-binding protein [Mycobacteriales bacterium]|nr:ATP-binding protein [Mycobacteriales bacterium]